VESEGSVIEGTNKTQREGMTLVSCNWQLSWVLGMTRKGDSVRVGSAMVKQVAMQEELYGVEARVINVITCGRASAAMLRPFNST
jgi:hypothetical protein